MTPGLSQNGPRAYFGILCMRYAREHRALLALVLEANRFFSLARIDSTSRVSATDNHDPVFQAASILEAHEMRRMPPK